jgi:hypothetical protein
MFDFLDNDIFVITINIFFLIFIIYDYKKYRATKQKMLLLNIAVTIGFAIWVMIPFYNKYLTWSDTDIAQLTQSCEHNRSICECLVNEVITSYSFESYCLIDANRSGFQSFDLEDPKLCFKD